MQLRPAEHPRHPQRPEALKGEIEHTAMAVARLLHGAKYRARLPASRKIHRAHVQLRFVDKGFVGHIGDLPSEIVVPQQYTTPNADMHLPPGEHYR